MYDKPCLYVNSVIDFKNIKGIFCLLVFWGMDMWILNFWLYIYLRYFFWVS